jgi:hypothetical protein
LFRPAETVGDQEVADLNTATPPQESAGRLLLAPVRGIEDTRPGNRDVLGASRPGVALHDRPAGQVERFAAGQIDLASMMHLARTKVIHFFRRLAGRTILGRVGKHIGRQGRQPIRATARLKWTAPVGRESL